MIEKLIKLWEVSSVTRKPETELIASKGLMYEYLLEKSSENPFGKGSIKDTRVSNWIEDVSDCEEYEHHEYNGNDYYVHSNSNHYYLFTEKPFIANEGRFVWKYNTKYNVYEAIVKDAVLEFHCIVSKETRKGKMIVRYTKCENKHRNNVAIAEISVACVVQTASVVFYEAIKNWKKDLITSLTGKVG